MSWYNCSHWLPIAWVWYHLMQSGHTGERGGGEGARKEHLCKDTSYNVWQDFCSQVWYDLINRWELDTPDASPVPPQDTHCTAVTYTPQLYQHKQHTTKCVLKFLCTTKVQCMSIESTFEWRLGHILTLAVLSCDPVAMSLSFGETSTELMSWEMCTHTHKHTHTVSCIRTCKLLNEMYLVMGQLSVFYRELHGMVTL